MAKILNQIVFKPFHSQFDSDEVYQMCDNYGESVTDTSTYKPHVSVVRAFLGSGVSSRKRFLYDFPDGKDTGQRIQTILRTKGLDITEVETAEKVMTQIIRDKTEADTASAESKKAQQDIIDAIKSAKDSLSNGSSDSSSQFPEQNSKQ